VKTGLEGEIDIDSRFNPGKQRISVFPSPPEEDAFSAGEVRLQGRSW